MSWDQVAVIISGIVVPIAGSILFLVWRGGRWFGWVQAELESLRGMMPKVFERLDKHTEEIAKAQSKRPKDVDPHHGEHR